MKKPKLYLNLGNPDLVDQYNKIILSEIDGIGLFRLEFLIATEIIQHPAVLIKKGKQDFYIQKIADGVKKVAKALYPKPVVVRFSDFKTNEYRGLLGGSEFELYENNPTMGFRGASRFISKSFGSVFRAEIQALMKVREQYFCDNVWPMIPFIRTFDEAKHCLDIMSEEGFTRKASKIWMMVETPAAAFQINHFNKLPFDGYSIGSNDLIQFILAVDRENNELQMTGYYDEENPAIIEVIRSVIQAAHLGYKTCSFCGNIVSNSLSMVTKVVEFDIDSISINADSYFMIKAHLDHLELD